jgi:N-acetylmuramoyl-L-alanine amidase
MANIGTLFYILWLLVTSLFSLSPTRGVPEQRFNDIILHSDTISLGEFHQKIVKTSEGQIRKIVIDAGHGGHDHGCSGEISNEKEITLSIALKLGNYIESNYPGIEVIFTRKTDVFVPLHERINLANKLDADIFLSIHANAFSNSNVSGTEVFVMGLHTAEENLMVAKRENASVLLESDFEQNYDGFDPNSPEAQIILSMYQNVFLDKSISIAEKITDNISENTGMINRGVKQAGFVILRKAAMPSVLIESGFLSNREDEAILHTDEGQAIVAEAIGLAIGEYQEESIREMAHLKTLKGKNGGAIHQDDNTPTDDIVYRVQLGAFSQSELPGIPETISGESIDVIYENGLKKIIAGRFPDYETAKAYQTRLRQDGTFSQCFVVAYQKDQRIAIDEAMKTKQKRS